MKRSCLITGLLAATLLALLAGCAQIQKAVPALAPEPMVKPDFKAAQRLYVQASALNLRQCPSTDCRIVSVLKKGQAVRLEALKGGWCQVTVTDGARRGWVAARYLDKTIPTRSRPVTATEPPPLPKEQWAPSSQQPPPVKEEYSK